MQRTLDEANAKIKDLQREIRWMQEAAERKNKALDAQHWVWCSGGCQGGMYWYTAGGHPDNMDELIKTAERNISRWKSWWANYQRKYGKKVP